MIQVLKKTNLQMPLALATLLIPTAAAGAEEPAELFAPPAVTAQDAETIELRNFFDAHDVPKSQQDDLLEKLDRGEPWDSFDGKNPTQVTHHRDGDR